MKQNCKYMQKNWLLKFVQKLFVEHSSSCMIQKYIGVKYYNNIL